MFRSIGYAILCGILLNSGPATGQGQPPLRVKPAQVIDSTGFGQPLTAFTIMVPHAWQTNGGVTWGADGQCNQMGYNFDWWATSPDGTQGVGVLPTLRWVSANAQSIMNPCPDLGITSARDLLRIHAQRLVPDGRELDYRPRPDLLREVGVPQGNEMRYPNPGGEMVLQWDAGEMLIGYTRNGQEFRASLSAVASFWVTRIFPAYGMPGLEAYGGNSMPGYAAFAPAGQLDLGIAETIRQSIQPGQEWSQRIAQHRAKINGINQRGQTEIARINREGNAEISRIINEGYESRRAIQDRGHRETIEAIRGVETYADPAGGSVQLDNTYNNAWALDDGTYVLTNDEFFEPFRDIGLSGQRLQALE